MVGETRARQSVSDKHVTRLKRDTDSEAVTDISYMYRITERVGLLISVLSAQLASCNSPAVAGNNAEQSSDIPAEPLVIVLLYHALHAV